MKKDKHSKSDSAVSAKAESSHISSSRSILVIDSGVGGLSVCQSILEKNPHLQIIYFADNAYFPYGVLPENDLSERLTLIVEQMLAVYKPELVVLACNTVSTLMLPILRALHEIPFVGVVPAIKPAALISKTKRIGLLATPATISRPYTDQLINDYAQGCEVVRVGSSELVVEAEHCLMAQNVNQSVLERVLAPFKTSSETDRVDTIVLGCTHFPLLKVQLDKVMPGINWVDSGTAIANRVSFLLSEYAEDNKRDNNADFNVSFHNSLNNNLSYDASQAKHQFYFSKPLMSQSGLNESLKAMGFSEFEFHTFNENICPKLKSPD